MAPTSETDSGRLADILAFYKEAGVDEPIEETPIDRFAEFREKKARSAEARPEHGVEVPLAPPRAEPPHAGQQPRTPTPAAASRQAHVAVPDEGQAARAREAARNARSLEELKEVLAAFDGCNLKFTAKNLVFADGNPAADLMLVGEAPGRDEDLEGLPFVGRSGQLLDRILKAIGRDRGSAYIANVIPWRPPGNRDPSPMETEICRPFIERQIELVAPKVLVTLGNPSTKLLLGATEGILRFRGKWRTHATASGLSIPAMPTLHPAYLLRNPAHKKLAWRDFLEVKAKLKS